MEIAFFELYRRDVASGIVPTLEVVEHLDVIEDIGPSVLPGEIDLTPNAFALEQLEEALGHCVALKKGKDLIASGRAVFYTSKAVVLVDDMGRAKRTPTADAIVEVIDTLPVMSNLEKAPLPILQ